MLTYQAVSQYIFDIMESLFVYPDAPMMESHSVATHREPPNRNFHQWKQTHEAEKSLGLYLLQN